MDRMSPQDRERAMEQQAKGTQFFTEYLYPVVILVINLVIAVLLFGTFTFVAGAKLDFKTTFAIVMFAGLPGILRFLLSIGSVLAGADPDSFSLQNPVATNPGYFLKPADSPVLFSLGSSLDIFLIWTLLLCAIGFTRVAKVKRETSFAIVFGWWIVFSLIGAGVAAAFS
jgi:hypothetical protein